MAAKKATKKAAKKSTKRRTTRKPEDTSPTGPHTPVSNVAAEVAAARALVSRPETGTEKGALKVHETGTELRRAEKVTLEAAAAEPEAPTAVLRDIGAASFPDTVTLETVHGAYDRIQVEKT